MKNAHGYHPIQNKAELIDHLLDQHRDTVFGGRSDLEQEPLAVLTESHRYAHFGPLMGAKKAPAAKRRPRKDRPLPILQDLVDGVLVGPPGARPGTFRRRGPEERQVIASAEAWARRDEIRPERHVVPLQRTQTVYVEVEACASTEAAWAAVQNAELTDEQWAQGEGCVRSAFWSRDLDADDSDHSSFAVGPG